MVSARSAMLPENATTIVWRSAVAVRPTQDHLSVQSPRADDAARFDVHADGEVGHGAVLHGRGTHGERAEIEGVGAQAGPGGPHPQRKHPGTRPDAEELQQALEGFDVLRPAEHHERRLALQQNQALDQGGQAIRVVRVQVRDDRVGEGERVHPRTPELLHGAPAAVHEHGALRRHEDERGRVARRRRDRAGGAEEGEVGHGSRRSASGSNSESGRFVLTRTERTANSIRSLPPTNSSWRYGKKKPPGSRRCSENARSRSAGPVGSVSRVTKRTTPYSASSQTAGTSRSPGIAPITVTGRPPTRTTWLTSSRTPSARHSVSRSAALRRKGMSRSVRAFPRGRAGDS